MQTCSLCSPGQQGYSVAMDSEESVAHAEAFLSERKLPYERVATHELWIASPAMKDCVECSMLFAPVVTWRFKKSLRLGAAKFETVTDACDWEEVERQLPAVFVDSLIASNSIRMMRQPIVNVAENNRTVAYEMLARGYNEDGALIPPMVMFQEARAQNRLFALDKHCRIEAVKAASQMSDEAAIFINFIPTAIYRPEHCLQTTMAAARAARINPGQLVFEVVETDYVEDTPHLKSIFEFYRKNGIRCALDDVGAGYNGVEMIKALAPHVVKLDRSIADGVANDAEKQEQAVAVQRCAAEVGAIPLAEGIESPADSRVLAMMGYSWQQGYLFGKPTFAENNAPADTGISLRAA